jgi:hypothetical protein
LRRRRRPPVVLVRPSPGNRSSSDPTPCAH